MMHFSCFLKISMYLNVIFLILTLSVLPTRGQDPGLFNDGNKDLENTKSSRQVDVSTLLKVLQAKEKEEESTTKVNDVIQLLTLLESEKKEPIGDINWREAYLNLLGTVKNLTPDPALHGLGISDIEKSLLASRYDPLGTYGLTLNHDLGVGAIDRPILTSKYNPVSLYGSPSHRDILHERRLAVLASRGTYDPVLLRPSSVLPIRGHLPRRVVPVYPRRPLYRGYPSLGLPVALKESPDSPNSARIPKNF